MSDPYQLLGVAKTASDKEIKAAYRRLAKKYHPDVNQNDPKIAEKFQNISSAYELLSNKEKRQQYDSGQIDENGNPTNPFGSGFSGGTHAGGHPFGSGFDFGNSSGGFSAEDIFSSIFGGGMGGRKGTQWRADYQASAQKGTTHSYTLKIGFLEAAVGTTRQITLSNGRTVSLKIPPGISNHEKLRLKGKGAPGQNGGPAGDALIEILVAEHSYFTREGLSILLNLPITFYEAYLGAKVKVPTIHGPLNLKIPEKSQSGKALRLKGKGIHKGSEKGDQIITLQIMLPETSEANFEKFAKEQEKNFPYNPRKKME
jgi:DnaJ-class molecular chaperone